MNKILIHYVCFSLLLRRIGLVKDVVLAWIGKVGERVVRNELREERDGWFAPVLFLPFTPSYRFLKIYLKRRRKHFCTFFIFVPVIIFFLIPTFKKIIFSHFEFSHFEEKLIQICIVSILQRSFRIIFFF